jgi:acyl-CoA synthetase (NDP forming)
MPSPELRALLRGVLEQGREVLLEHEVLALLRALGRRVPAHHVVPRSRLGEDDAWEAPLSGRVVLKALAPSILHKTDVGALAWLDEYHPERAREAAVAMLARLPDALASDVRALLVEVAVPHVRGPGHELLLGCRHSEAFGPVYALGFGGTATEAFAGATRDDQATILLAPGVTTARARRARLEQALFFRWSTGGLRGIPGLMDADVLEAALLDWLAALERVREAAEAEGRTLAELELNPLVWSEGEWVPVDALLRLGPPSPPARPLPLSQLRRGLVPERVAVVGASPRRRNLGHIILENALAAGFPPERLFAVHETAAEILGLTCVPTVDALPEPVDLLLVAVPASAVLGVVEETVASERARCVLLVTAGMGETEGGRALEARLGEAVDAVAASPSRPVLVGGNSLGLWSRPARFDSFFVPQEKLPRPTGLGSGLAVVSQSGAFLLTLLGRLRHVTPDLLLSLGNQVDVRVSHAVAALAEEPSIRTIALYVEGLKPGDGAALAALVRELRSAGRDLILYKGGRSALGQRAAQGHTASLAGDYRVFSTVLRDAGALLAERLPDFLGLIRLSLTLRDKQVRGSRLALMSNAGYEAVSLADWHAEGTGAAAASLAEPTRARLQAALRDARLDGLVNVQNPLDLTPMAGDALHEACARALLEDPGVDAAVFGTIPLTPHQKTLGPGLSKTDAFDAPDAYGPRMAALFRETSKPFAVVIDAGEHYGALVSSMEAAGLPVFDSADRAVVLLGRYLQSRSLAV